MARNQLSRGEIWLIDLGLAQKHRPAVIMSIAYLDHERALVAYVPRTTSLRGSRFEVAHQAQGFLPGAFEVQSLGSVPVVKLVRRIGKLDAATLAKVENTLRLWLGL
jgi:mRNA interferase MazF